MGLLGASVLARPLGCGGLGGRIFCFLVLRVGRGGLQFSLLTRDFSSKWGDGV